MTRHEPLRSWREATGCPFRMATPAQCHREAVARMLPARFVPCLILLAFLALVKAGELGFEPRLTDPESVVLPLHHSPNAGGWGPTFVGEHPEPPSPLPTSRFYPTDPSLTRPRAPPGACYCACPLYTGIFSCRSRLKNRQAEKRDPAVGIRMDGGAAGRKTTRVSLSPTFLCPLAASV